MELKAYAKINLSLDIIGCREDGYHNISSLMQNIDLFDVIKIDNCSPSGTKYKASHCFISGHGVYLCSNVETIPLGDDNLAIKGARAVLEAIDTRREEAPSGFVGKDCEGTPALDEITIFIDKQLPVAAGIAGGSGNAAAVMLGINAMTGNLFSMRELMAIGAHVGADVPFSIMMNARKNAEVLGGLRGIEEASVSAWTRGIGDIVEPTESIHRYVIMANPGISVSTRAAYEAIDTLKDYTCGEGLFTNQMESYTLSAYPEAAELKQAMIDNLDAELVLMSGSGPTMVAYYQDKDIAERDYEKSLSSGWLKAEWRVWLTETGAAGV